MGLLMAKRVSLSVHRNTVERRRKSDLAKAVTGDVEALIREQDIRAYAIVGIAASGKAFCFWDTGAIMPMWAFPATIGEAVRRDMEESGISEDWVPALTVKGGE